MPPDSTKIPILGGATQVHKELWNRLAAGSWPLPLPLLPRGAVLVGGAVRDGLLGRLGERPDLDLVVPGDGLALARQLAQELGGTAVVLDEERSIGRLVLQRWTIDLARQAGETLAEDLGQRDFTVNAMALRLPVGGGELALEDPLRGLEDLRSRQLRAIAEANLLADPLRLLRGVRLATELHFSLTDQTWEWILRHRACLATVAGERVLAELQRLVSCAEGERGVQLLGQSGLLEAWPPSRGAGPAPTATDHLTAEEARLRGLTEEEAREALPLARLAALLDEETLGALRASNTLRRRCRHLRRWRVRLESLGRPGTLGWEGLPEAEQLEMHRQMGVDLPALLLELPPPSARRALARWRDPADPLFHPASPLDGLELQRQLGLPPGRRLGQLLEHLTAERAFGRLPRVDPSGRQCLAAARLWLEATRDPCHD